jgi:ubiquinone/menaquinone biosynthesis C-methylase UbiE
MGIEGGEMILGIQTDGVSTGPVYAMAESAISSFGLPRDAKIIDLGGGFGIFSRILLGYFAEVDLADFDAKSDDPSIHAIPANLITDFPFPDESYDAVVCLEVIEHVENPRHLFREIKRILKLGGRGIVTTPNQISLSSKACLLVRNQFQWFQDSCYPAHISALLPIDLLRIAAENDLEDRQVFYSGYGRIPGIHKTWQQISQRLGGAMFSDNVGISFQKPRRP